MPELPHRRFRTWTRIVANFAEQSLNTVKLLILLFVFLSGCAVNEGRVALPDGSTGYSVRCPGASSEKCLNLAAQICSGPYTILTDQSYQVTGAYRGNLFSAPIEKVMFQCANR